MDLPLGWQTDLAVLRLSGSEITDAGDHLVVRTPANPGYYWGNCLLVTDAAKVDDPDGWLAAFEAAFPDAPHRAIGLVSAPSDPAAWLATRLFIEEADVLRSDQPITPTAVPDGYEVRSLGSGDDWEQSTRLRQQAFPEQDAYEERTTAVRRSTEGLTWFGAFADGALAAELGIADCGDGTARYQSVLTAAHHRRRGLTRHLLAVASAHAWEQGARQLVIVADGDSDASRLYRAAGFAFAEKAYQVSRVPQPED